MVIQVVKTIFPAFGFGDAAVRIVTIVFGIGLLPALVFAWAFEPTPEGRTPGTYFVHLSSQASTSLCQSRPLAGDRTQWFSSGK